MTVCDLPVLDAEQAERLVGHATARYEAALLYTYSLHAPATAAQVREQLASMETTTAGHTAGADPQRTRRTPRAVS